MRPHNDRSVALQSTSCLRRQLSGTDEPIAEIVPNTQPTANPVASLPQPQYA